MQVSQALMALALALGPLSAWAAPTRAATDISNVATATYTDPAGTPQTVDSNRSTIRVAEVIGLALTLDQSRNVSVTAPDTGDALTFSLTNSGNGVETFTLAANPALTGDQYDPILVSLVLDLNGNGLFEPGIDPVHVPGANDPQLEPGASITIFAVHDTPAGLADGAIGRSRLTATAATGTGPAGTIFAADGDGGVDAVIGTSTGARAVEGGYEVARVAAALNKTQAVADPFGGSLPVPGAIITYTLSFEVTGSGSLLNVQIADPIPAQTVYVPGSLQLDAAALTDIADADAGRFTGAGIEVGFGTLAAPATRVIRFQVRIE